MASKLAEQIAETLYDLFRAAPIPCNVNGEMGKAAFFARDAQLAQAKGILDEMALRVFKLTRDRAIIRACWLCASPNADEYPLDPSGRFHISEELTGGSVACNAARIRTMQPGTL